MSDTAALAAKSEAFLDACIQAGFTFSARRFDGNRSYVLVIERSFDPGDSAAYVEAELEGMRLLMMATVTETGSIWGTTSDGVGGHHGLTHGYVRLCRSGVGIRFIQFLSDAYQIRKQGRV